MGTSRHDYLKQMLLTGASLAAAPYVVAGQTAESGVKPQTSADLFAATHEQRIAWWREARFGIFMHFGLYSVPSRGEWLLAVEDIPISEYEKFADSFHPAPGSTRDWASAAKGAGMKYMVLTTKHHEGFCLFDTKLTDYCATKMGPRWDIIAEYVGSARAEGLRVGFYFSLMDWHYPDWLLCAEDEAARRRFVDFVHGQVRELMTNYGQIDILWYDMCYPMDAKGFEAERLNRMVLELQPSIVVNNRSGMTGDFSTPEQNTNPAKGDWESCMTLNDNWGYAHADDNWKSVRSVISNLVKCSMYGGNYLLDVGPQPDGKLPDECVKILRGVGEWTKRYGESIYGSCRSEVLYCSFGQFTQRGNTVYAHVDNWVGTEMVVAGVKARLRSVRFLDSNLPVKFEQNGGRILLKGLPSQPPYTPGPVIALEFDESPVQDTMATRIIYKVLPNIKPADAKASFERKLLANEAV
jgi:alpha-L-fucosidase